jgi:hypothetical protein
VRTTLFRPESPGEPVRALRDTALRDLAGHEGEAARLLADIVGATVISPSRVVFPRFSAILLTEAPDPVLRRYAELEKPGSLYVTGLGHTALCRGLGLSTAVMEATEARDEVSGFDQVSTLCVAMHTGACRLSEQRGYHASDGRLGVPHPMQRCDTGEVVLLVTTLG